MLIAVCLTRSSITAEEAGNLVKSSPAAFLAPDANAALRALLASFDIFNLWTVALLILALSTIGNVTKTRSAAIVVGCWWIYIVLKMGGATIAALMKNG